MIPKEITLDRPRHILFSTWGIVEALPTIGDTISAFPPNEPEVLRAWLWVGLRHEDPNLTLEETGRLIETYLPDPIARRDLLIELGRLLARNALESLNSNN
jgi:hypothetical protein